MSAHDATKSTATASDERTACSNACTGRVPELVGLRALVVDRDLDACVQAASMLEQMGMRCEWTTSGKEAAFRIKLAADEGDEFQAYVIDQLMPDVDSAQIIRDIRREVGESAPVVLLSDQEWGEAPQDLAIGATAFAAKPLGVESLKRALTAPLRITSDRADDDPLVADAIDADFSGRRLLLAEDNALNREIATKILTAAGFMVETAENGRAAVSMVSSKEAGHYDVLLMDTRMPIMDGYEATRAIRSLSEARRSNMPIIAMSASNLEEDRQRAMVSGMDDLVAKPVNVPHLMQTLARYVA